MRELFGLFKSRGYQMLPLSPSCLGHIHVAYHTRNSVGVRMFVASTKFSPVSVESPVWVKPLQHLIHRLLEAPEA